MEQNRSRKVFDSVALYLSIISVRAVIQINKDAPTANHFQAPKLNGNHLHSSQQQLHHSQPSQQSSQLKPNGSFHSNTTIKTRLTTILNHSTSSQNCPILTRTPSQASSTTPPLQQQKSITTTTTTTDTTTSKQATIDEYLNNEIEDDEDDDALFKKYTKDYQTNLDYYLHDEQKYSGTEAEVRPSPTYSIYTNNNYKKSSFKDLRKKSAKTFAGIRPTKMNLFKNQREKFIFFQKIISQNIIIMPISVLLTLVVGVLLGFCLFTPFYEYIDYDIEKLHNLIVNENNSTMQLIKQKSLQTNDFTVNNTYIYYLYSLINSNNLDYYVLTRTTLYNTINNTNRIHKFYLYKTYSGIWESCNNLTDSSLSAFNITKCHTFTMQNIDQEELHMASILGSRLVRLQNTAACCLVICIILLFCSFITGIISIVFKYVPVTMATGVFHVLISTFLLFLLAIMHAKIFEESRLKNCFELKIIFHIICLVRHVTYGYSFILAWSSFFLSILTSSLWLYLTKVQKILVNLNGNYYH